MLSRFKSSLEKRAPSVIGALRNLRGQPEAPAAAAPVTVAKPAPVAVAKPAPAAPPAAAKPAPAASPAAAKTAPAAVVEPAPTAVAEPAPAVTPAADAAPAAPATAEAKPAAQKAAKASAKAATKAAEAGAAPAPEAKPAEATPAAKPAAEAKPAAKAEAKHEKAPEKAKHQAADTGSTDIGAYIARAKANGRDPSLIKGTEGMNIADDGTPYWGPLENESSREKAAKKLLVIDQFECISCGTCVEQTEKVFYLPIDGKATPIAQDGPMDLIQDAIEACPVTCIHWVTPEEAVERNLTSGVEG